MSWSPAGRWRGAGRGDEIVQQHMAPGHVPLLTAMPAPSSAELGKAGSTALLAHSTRWQMQQTQPALQQRTLAMQVLELESRSEISLRACNNLIVCNFI